MSQEFRFKNIDETRNYFLEEIKYIELMSRKHKMVCTTLTYIEHFLFFNFYNNWMYFNFCFSFFDWYSYREYKFCNTITNLGNNCRN